VAIFGGTPVSLHVIHPLAAVLSFGRLREIVAKKDQPLYP
jgi:hypothetical protein